MKKMPLLVLVLACAGCPKAYPDPIAPNEPPECGIETLGSITAAYTAALIMACSSEKKLETCPEAQRKPVEEKFAPLFDAWEKCGK